MANGSEEAVIKTLYQMIKTTPKNVLTNAKTFHDWVERYLKERGYTVEREYGMPHIMKRGNKSGFIDLVITSPTKVAIELDRYKPRKGSSLKVTRFTQKYGGIGVVITRSPSPKIWGI